MSNAKNLFAQDEHRDFTRAVRMLLRHPLLTAAAQPEAFALVRRAREGLEQYFKVNCDWRLDVDPRAGYARLHKIRPPDPRRPLRRARATKAPYDRLRYIVLCVTAAELLNRPVTTIGILADQLAHTFATDTALPSFDTAERGDRAALVDVLKTFEDLGALVLLDGTADGYLDSSTAKALLKAEPAMLMNLLAAPQAPTRVAASDAAERVHGLLWEPRQELSDEDTEAIRVRRNQRSRHRLMRRLLEDPVVHYERITEDELTYLRSSGGRRTIGQAAANAGMVLEERADGVMFVDPDALSTDDTFPDTGTAKQTALLLLDRLTTTGTLTREELHAHLADRMAEHPRWARSYRPDGTARLLREALDVLAAFELIDECNSAAIRALPAAHRYRLTEVKTTTGEGDSDD
ncbi:TIGR02678 family protein [Phytomonospora sp. NPDC050363]|uniref:TIGR02678 family protein n=1 Tax=Phytomonospora sp. NPDC050363 TaxID=3155642 RepID=UPI0033C3AE09